MLVWSSSGQDACADELKAKLKVLI